MSHDYIPLLEKALWPITTLFLVLWFRKEIATLISKLSGIDIRSGVVSFGQAPSDVKVGRETSQRPEIAKNISASASQLKWENSANLFWLGSDLEWTSQTVLREAPRDKILHGLRQCQHHSAELGLTDTGPGRELNALKSEVTNTSDANINRKWRIDFSEKVYAVVRGFSGLIREHQPSFRPKPE